MKRVVLQAALGLSLAMNVVVVALVLVRTAETASPKESDLDCVIPRMDLSEDEHRRAVAARGDFVVFCENHQARMADLRERLATLLSAPEPERTEMDEILAKMSGMQADYQKRVIERVLAVREALSPGNRDQYDELLLPRIRGGGALLCRVKTHNRKVD